MNTSQTYGLTPKTTAVSNDDKIINLKIRVPSDFHERWTKTIGKLSKAYSGGGTAIAFKALNEALPHLEELAAKLPDQNAKPATKEAKGGAK